MFPFEVLAENEIRELNSRLLRLNLLALEALPEYRERVLEKMGG